VCPDAGGRRDGRRFDFGSRTSIFANREEKVFPVFAASFFLSRPRVRRSGYRKDLITSSEPSPSRRRQSPCHIERPARADRRGELYSPRRRRAPARHAPVPRPFFQPFFFHPRGLRPSLRKTKKKRVRFANTATEQTRPPRVTAAGRAENDGDGRRACFGALGVCAESRFPRLPRPGRPRGGRSSWTPTARIGPRWVTERRDEACTCVSTRPRLWTATRHRRAELFPARAPTAPPGSRPPRRGGTRDSAGSPRGAEAEATTEGTSTDPDATFLTRGFASRVALFRTPRRRLGAGWTSARGSRRLRRTLMTNEKEKKTPSA